jgi:DNA-binding response OmpR family regulator
MRVDARGKAHKLAGSLGVVGLAAAGHHAKAIEALLAGDAPLDARDSHRLAELAVAVRDAIDAGPVQEIARPPGPLISLVVPDQATRDQLEAEAAALDFTVVSTGAPVDGALVSFVADPLLITARKVATSGGRVVVHGAVGSAAERTAVMAIPSATYLAPDSNAHTAMRALRDAIASAQRISATHVLVVDDDPLIHTAVRRALEPHGARVTAIADPFDTFDALERDPPDVVLLDINMPGMTGIELCRLIRADARWSRLVVIFCAVSTEPATIQRVWSAGADDYVPKPIGPALLSRIGARLAMSPRTPIESASVSGTVDVVIVEDDAPLAHIIVGALEQSGLRVSHLDDGAIALERLAGTKRDLSPRVVLLDVGLPGVDGYEILRRIVAHPSPAHSRVIMLTARAAEPEVVRAFELGAFDHIAKPFSVPVLVHRVRRAL